MPPGRLFESLACCSLPGLGSEARLLLEPDSLVEVLLAARNVEPFRPHFFF